MLHLLHYYNIRHKGERSRVLQNSSSIFELHVRPSEFRTFSISYQQDKNLRHQSRDPGLVDSSNPVEQNNDNLWRLELQRRVQG